MLGPVRAIAVGVRDWMDGVRHVDRRAHAIHLIRDRRPSHVLFVCLGNICRSPFAGALASDRGLKADSVGFIGPGRNPPHEAIAAALRRGIDHADHVSREMTREDVEWADLVVVFDRFNVQRVRDTDPSALKKTIWLGDLDPVWTGKRAVIDPWGRGEAYFDTTFERIERCVDQLSSALAPE